MLTQLANRYGSDKSDKNHKYTAIYEQYFDRLVHKPIKLLEIGIRAKNSEPQLLVFHPFLANRLAAVEDLNNPALQTNKALK